jgi:hypothetical protein
LGTVSGEQERRVTRDGPERTFPPSLADATNCLLRASHTPMRSKPVFISVFSSGPSTGGAMSSAARSFDASPFSMAVAAAAAAATVASKSISPPDSTIGKAVFVFVGGGGAFLFGDE